MLALEQDGAELTWTWENEVAIHIISAHLFWYKKSVQIVKYQNVNQVLTAGWDRLACIWDVDTGELLQVTIDHPHHRHHHHLHHDHYLLCHDHLLLSNWPVTMRS